MSPMEVEKQFARAPSWADQKPAKCAHRQLDGRAGKPSLAVDSRRRAIYQDDELAKCKRPPLELELHRDIDLRWPHPRWPN